MFSKARKISAISSGVVAEIKRSRTNFVLETAASSARILSWKAGSLNGVKIDARKINEICNDMVALGLNPVHVAKIMDVIIKIFKDIDLDAALGASPYESLYTHAVSDVLGYYLFYKAVENEDKAYLDTITSNLFNMSKEDVFEYLGLVKNSKINKDAIKEMQKVYINNIKKFW